MNRIVRSKNQGSLNGKLRNFFFSIVCILGMLPAIVNASTPDFVEDLLLNTSGIVNAEFGGCYPLTSGGTICGDITSCGPVCNFTINSSSLPSGGSGTIQYLWLKHSYPIIYPNNGNNGWTAISGATNATLNYSGCVSATTYFIRCSKRSGCTTYNGESNYVSVIINPVPTISATVSNNCGNSVLTASNYSGSLLWSNGATTSSITVTNSATYTVKVTSSNGCTNSVCVTSAPKTKPNAPTVSVNNICGSSILTASNYNGALLWSNGSTASSITVTNSAVYTVTVTSSNGCTNSVCVTSAPKTIPNAPTVSVNNICGSSILTASNYNGTLLWNNGSTASSITVTNSAIYTVTVTSSNGCTNSVCVTSAPKTIPNLPTVSVNNICGSSILTASNYIGTLLWSNGSTASSITVTNSAVYTVTVTSSNGCTSSKSVTSAPKSIPNLPAISTINNGSCLNPVCSGSVTANPAGGTPAYGYLWNTGATTSSLSGLCGTVTPGISYSVTVTDANGCSAINTGSVICTPPPPCQNPSVSISGATSVCTATSATTVLTATPAGAASYQWSNGATTQTTIVNASGTYSVTVVASDYNCVGTASHTVTFSNCCPLTSGGSISGDITSCGPVCNFTINSVTLPSGGAGTVEYMWMMHASPNSYPNYGNNGWSAAPGVNTDSAYTYPGCLTETTYFIRCSRNTGCGSYNGETNFVSVIINPVPTTTVGVINNGSCLNPVCSGSVTANPAGGTPAYSYLWNTGATTSSLNGLCGTVTPGVSYSVTVTDANGCSAINTGSVICTPPPPCQNPSVSISGATSVCTANTTLTALPSNAASYVWSGPNGFSAITENVVITASGIYSVTVVSSEYDCIGTATHTVSFDNCCVGFKTLTQGGWGAVPHGNNPGTYLHANFSSAFLSGLQVGGVNCTGSHWLKLTSAQSITNFLPSGGTPTKLLINWTNPAAGSLNNTLAGQVVAAALNIGFDSWDPNFSSNSIQLKNLYFNSGTFAGWTVQQVFDEANKKLSGCSSSYTYSQLTNALNVFNKNYDNGTRDLGKLSCTYTCAKIENSSNDLTQLYSTTNTDLNMAVYPNPFIEQTTFELVASEDVDAVLELYSVTGALISEIYRGEMKAGEKYNFEYNAHNLASGIYFAKLTTSDGSVVRNIVKIQ